MGTVRCDRGIFSCAEGVGAGFSELKSAGRVMKWNPMLQKRRPAVMTGTEYRRMRLLPTRSISRRATQVIRKFVIATDMDVKVGLAKPRIVKMVAEKYIKEFCGPG